MANTKHEDAIMKMGFDYFRDTLAKTLGVNENFVDSGPTELISLQIHALYMDFTFLTDKDIYIHFEFQSTETDSGDLRRFLAYEALLSNKTGKQVITYVIYSGGIIQSKTDLDCGIYTYRVQPIYLTIRDADDILTRLENKRALGRQLTEEDFAQLSLTPLMTNRCNRKNTIKMAILLAKPDTHITAQKTIAILYTLADKFLENNELEEIKEAISMTRLGQMIFDDGVRSGIIQGELNGKIEGKIEGEYVKLIKLVCKKLDKHKSIEEIADDLEEDIATITPICEIAKTYAPNYNFEEIYKKLLDHQQ